MKLRRVASRCSPLFWQREQRDLSCSRYSSLGNGQHLISLALQAAPVSGDLAPEMFHLFFDQLTRSAKHAVDGLRNLGQPPLTAEQTAASFCSCRSLTSLVHSLATLGPPPHHPRDARRTPLQHLLSVASATALDLARLALFALRHTSINQYPEQHSHNTYTAWSSSVKTVSYVFLPSLYPPLPPPSSTSKESGGGDRSLARSALVTDARWPRSAEHRLVSRHLVPTPNNTNRRTRSRRTVTRDRHPQPRNLAAAQVPPHPAQRAMLHPIRLPLRELPDTGQGPRD